MFGLSLIASFIFFVYICLVIYYTVLYFIDDKKINPFLRAYHKMMNKNKYKDNIQFNTNNINNHNTLYEEYNELLTGKDFEEFIAKLLGKYGYSTSLTRDSHDFGADVIAEKDEIRYAIQCKYWQNSVGIEAVQQVCAARHYYNCDKSVVVTNNKFTKQAKELAQVNRVLLWDGEYIKSKIVEKEN